MTSDDDPTVVTVTLNIPAAEAAAFLQLVRRLTYDDCVRLGSRQHHRHYPDGREESDVMWAAIQIVERQFGEHGIEPR